MPKDDTVDEVHYDKAGRKYYTTKKLDKDQSAKSRFLVGS